MFDEYEALKAKYGDLYEEELRVESKYKQDAQDHLQITLNRYKAQKLGSETKIGRKLTTYRIEMLTEAYVSFVEKALRPKAGVKPEWVNALYEMDNSFKDDRKTFCSMLAFSILTQVINFMSDNGGHNPVVNIAKLTAPIIIAECQYNEFLKYLLEHDMDKEKSIFKVGLESRVSPFYRRHYMAISMEKDNYTPKPYNTGEVVMLVVQLLSVAENVLEYYNIKKLSDHSMPMLVPTQKYIDGWKRNEEHLINGCYSLCPTVIPPQPWTDYNHGGYYGDLLYKNKLLRLDGNKSNIWHKRYMRLLKQTDLSDVLKALNGIQATPWVINKKVLEVVNEIVRQGGNKAGLPHFDEDPKPMVLSEEPTPEELAKYKEVMPPWYKKEQRRKSLVLRALAHIRVANEFSKYKKLYFPCNMDFRGRIYPIPSFNFQGDDLNKGLILFADPPAFDSTEDKQWLAITGCNLAGFDKISFSDRIKWIYDNEQNILLSAEDPLSFLWWSQQDEPIQFLSFCFEWARLKQYEIEHDGSCIGFVTGLPSHQDGTCSGLQHFSAILRDPVGGTAVNLVPQDKPNDIYGLVAVEVNKLLVVDATHGTPDEVTEEGKVKYGTKTKAQLWLSFGVNRKVCKRPTMTLAYGAREYGYRDQIMEDTIEPAIREQGEACVFNKHNKWQASAYMANLIWNSIDKVVVKACEGMNWLQTCSKKVTKKGQSVTWITPLGLPVHQHYQEAAYDVVRMVVAGKRLRVYLPKETGNVDKLKQTNGIAPNFIHSMDACHLMLSIDYCIDAGIKHFATIHDSYGCPMAQTKLMYKLVRQAFVDLYSNNDVLQKFKEDMQLITKDKIPDPPSKGTLDLSCVLDSKYVFC